LEKKNINYVLNNGKFLIKILENKYKTVEAQLITQYSIKVAVSKTNIYKKISESSSIDIETVSSILNEYKKFIHPFEKTVSSTNIGRNIVNGRQWNELLQLQQKLIKKGIHINPNSLEKQDKLYLVDNGKYIIKFSEYRNTKKEFSAKIINQETFKIGK
jgi:hypothetical protein